MRRFFILTAFLAAIASCQSVDSNVKDLFVEDLGHESFRAIEFSIKDTSATKSPTPITSMSQFNVTATTGSAGSEASKLDNVVFADNNKSGVFRSDAMWPSSDPGYHFYASNMAMTHTASGQTVSISSIDKDVVCAYLASPSYKVKNDLAFNHILARVGTVTFTNLSLCTDVKLSMKYSGSGTYNIETGSWSNVGSQSTKELSTADNDFWIIPGNYQTTLTYTDANGTPQSKTLNQDFLAGKVNNISAKLDGSVVVKTEEEYEDPTFTLGTISDVPASGGDSGTPSVTAVGQRKRVKKTLADGTVKYDPDWTAVSSPDYTIQYGKDLSSLSDNCPSYHGDNLGTTEKSRSKLGVIYVRVKMGGETTDKSLEVYQAANARHKGQTAEKDHTRTGDISYGERNYSGNITYGEKKYGGEYLKDTSYDEKVQDADTFGEWETTGTSTYKYNYAVSFTSTSWSPGALSENKANAITASHLEKPQYDQRRKITHNYRTPYTQHYYKDWTRTNSRSYTCSASQNCNYIEYRTDTFDSGATDYVEENKSHTETWTASGTESNYSTDRGSDWSRDASGSTPSTSDGGYEYRTTYGDVVTPKTDTPSVSSDAGWLSWSSGTMYVTENKGSSRSTYLRATNGDASATCYVTQAGATITYKLTCTGSPISITVGDSKYFSGTVEYLKYINGNYDSKQNVTLSASFSTGSSSVATITSLSYLNSVKGVAAGTTKIYATYNGISSKDNNDSGIDVTVKEPDVITYKLVCAGSEVSMTVGETVSYTPVVTYKKYVNGNYDSEETVTKSASFSTGDNSIATVSTSGSGNFRTYMSTGVAAGTTKIYATYNGISSKDNGDSGISVTVTRKVTYSISVNPTSLTFGSGAAGSGSKQTATVTCPEGDWEVLSTPPGWTATKNGNTVEIYPDAANTGTEEKKGTVTVRCTGDKTKTADITVTQGKNTEKYDVEVD